MQLKFNKYFISYNFFISICAVALTLNFSLILNCKPPLSYYIFIFFGTLAAYNFLRHFATLKLFIRNRNGWAFYLIILGLTVSGIIYFMFSLYLKLYFISLGILVLFYTFPFSNTRNLRTLAFLKLFIIALVWIFTACSVLFFSETGLVVTYSQKLFIAAELFFFIAIIIPFDIHDVISDKFKTLPNTIGIKNSLLISKFCLVIYLMLIVFSNFTPSFKLGELLFTGIAFYVIHIQKKEQSIVRLHYFVDGLIIVQLVFTIAIAQLNL